MRWTNPYKTRIGDFPGRLFNFEHFESDVRRVREALLRRPRAICEFGSGSGGHLLELARRNPDAVLFGFEIRYKRSVRTAEKSLALGLDNIYVLRQKSETAPEIFLPEAFDAIYVNFPEPWDKPKRRKHRVLSPALLDTGDRLLKGEGYIALKTDHRDYFAEFLGAVAEDSRFSVVERSDDLYASAYLEQNIMTEFERLFRSQNLPIHYAKIARRPAGGRSTELDFLADR